MRLISDQIAKSAQRDADDKAHRNPVACALFIASLAVGVAGGTLWLTSAVVHSNAAAAQTIFSFEP